MVREDNPHKQEGVKGNRYETIWRLIKDAKKYANTSHKHTLYEHEMGGIFLCMNEEEREKYLYFLKEAAQSMNKTIDNTAKPIRENIKLHLSNITIELDKVAKNISINAKTLRSKNKTKNLITKNSYWLPRKYREGIIGDIMEDCHELRELGKSEWRIRIHVIWQLTIALIQLRPTALMDAFKRIWSTK